MDTYAVVKVCASQLRCVLFSGYSSAITLIWVNITNSIFLRKFPSNVPTFENYMQLMWVGHGGHTCPYRATSLINIIFEWLNRVWKHTHKKHFSRLHFSRLSSTEFQNWNDLFDWRKVTLEFALSKITFRLWPQGYLCDKHPICHCLGLISVYVMESFKPYHPFFPRIQFFQDLLRRILLLYSLISSFDCANDFVAEFRRAFLKLGGWS